jgi:20S proteasome subunit beta 3
MSTLLSHILYGQRQSPYYVEPIVAGLELVRERGEADCYVTKYIPYLCAFDVIGAKSISKSFVCSGTASMYGTAEAMWRPGLQPQDLARICGKAFISALERDCLSGYGALVYLMIGGEGVYEYDIACRND